MVDQLTLQTTISLLTLISLTIGVIYHIMTLRNTRKNQELQLETRQAQLYMNLDDTYHSPEFRKLLYEMLDLEWKDYDEWYEKVRGTNIPSQVAFGSVMGYFNGLGLLVRKGLIDIDTVYDLLATWIVVVWEKYIPIMQAQRDRRNRPIWGEFEYLYNEVKKIDQQHPELKT